MMHGTLWFQALKWWKNQTLRMTVGGLDEQILQVREAIELPLDKPELLERLELNHQREFYW